MTVLAELAGQAEAWTTNGRFSIFDSIWNYGFEIWEVGMFRSVGALGCVGMDTMDSMDNMDGDKFYRKNRKKLLFLA